MSAIGKPMLAGKVSDERALRYPVLASPKLDGIRCLIVNGEAVSRNFKPIRNDYIRTTLKKLGVPDGFDGELLVENGGFSEASSGVMSTNGQPDYYYNVFDWLGNNGPTEPFESRIERARDRVDKIADRRVRWVPHVIVHDPEELAKFEADCLARGFEGVMVRDPRGPYKFGRSSEKEGFLLKLKRFESAEGVVVGVNELYSNQNEAGTDAFGRTERSQAGAGMVPMGTMGSLALKLASGIVFNVGTGFDAALRQQLWNERKTLVGRIVTFKSQPTGVKDAPRFPVFLGFRNAADMDGE